LGADITVTRSKPIYLEFLNRAVNKGAGFEALCRALSIPTTATAAFGDAYNDIEMLRVAGTAIVVNNGVAEAKAAADLICPSNEDDGVAQVLEKWLANAVRPPAPYPQAMPQNEALPFAEAETAQGLTPAVGATRGDR
jgi:hydroxymethylpyrimidine pyrophosphatase-like HAD family hydrolase